MRSVFKRLFRLGRIGAGFAPMQLRLTVRRLQMGAWSIGICRRALDMMVEHVKQRVTFGQRLADRQAIQWWIADAATKIHACRLMVYDAATKADAGQDVRVEVDHAGPAALATAALPDIVMERCAQ